ncbi:MAG: 4-(cytidine 5'-diphospho)-2-C-methyl-D-erythritol kinase [Opitutaceae bacterium]
MSASSNSIELLSPAKINLMLSVHGPRDDGFHALTSVVVALDFGDRLTVTLSAKTEDRLTCSDPSVPVDGTNLILRAADLFRKATGRAVFFDFDLNKVIPMGAGLGGGSSNASTALKAMNALTGEPLSKASLFDLAAQIGSDCPFFIESKPSLMRGRGEIIEPIAESLADTLEGQRIVLFRPEFGVNTAWAYQQLKAQAPESYESEALAFERFARFEKSLRAEDLLFNSFEPIACRKFLSLSCLLDELRERGVCCLMSGSGSCCFAIIKESQVSSSHMHEICRNAWGTSTFWVDTSISKSEN